MSSIEKTMVGLRDALFDEINGLRSGKTTSTKAYATAKLAENILRCAELEVTFKKNLLVLNNNEKIMLGSE